MVKLGVSLEQSSANFLTTLESRIIFVISPWSPQKSVINKQKHINYYHKYGDNMLKKVVIFKLLNTFQWI